MNRCLVILLTIFLGCFLFTTSALASHEESQKHYTLVDENNNIIHRTGLTVYPGDEYISADNSRYKVVELVGYTARCIYQGEERMPVLGYNPQTQAWSFEEEIVPALSKSQKPTIAVYHTHSDESYVPSDGKESIAGNGGIYDVGEAFVNRLKKLGFNVVYSKNNHNPHDINAYSRSRETAVSLLKKAPDAIIDIHRDAVPASEYQTEVEGEEATKVKLVVGRQNPNMKTNLEFAKKIKAVMDKEKPGLSNGIFMGKGDYNQDLSPRAILLEVGAHTNSKEEAKEGAMLIAEALPAVFGLSGNAGAAAKPVRTDNQGAINTILTILIVLAVTAGGYYLLNKGTVNR
ncbi:MAG: stage II sporulation protein P [Syntrophomonadaceae bacterium]|jgi:stage II sporulation protein P